MSTPCPQPAGVLRPVVDRNRCGGRAGCVRVCPSDVFEVRRIEAADFATLSLLGKIKSAAHRRQTAYTPNASACEACGECVKACPEKAIKLQRAG